MYSSSPVIWTLKQFFNFFCSATAYYIEKNTWACSNPLCCSIHAKKIARLRDLRAVEHIRESGCRTRGYHSSGQRHISDVTLSPFGVSQPTLVSKSFNFCTADWGYPLGANPYHLRDNLGLFRAMKHVSWVGVTMYMSHVTVTLESPLAR